MNSASAADLFAQLVDEFTDRLNRGETPSVEEYARRHPLLAADLRAVLGMLPALRPESPSTGSIAPESAEGVSTLPDAAARTRSTPSAVTLNGYELHSELGRGGMGVVYLATQTLLQRPVALKMVLSGEHATQQERVRFLNEAGVLAKFQHPHLVQVYEFGADPQGRPYFALEFLSGGSLSGKLQDGPLTPAAAAGVLKALASAVGYAHARGVIHRDLKPANVLFAADGTPKITDFGLAKQTGSGEGLTATHAVLGTPSYMAPEQASGVTAAVGPAADVYALGAILYECLTGRPPFRGASVFDTLAQVRTREPIAVRELQPSVPKDLETVCLKCLQKDPVRRYPSAEALADDLERFLDGRAIAARPVSAAEKGWRWCKRNRLLATFGGLAAGLLLAVAVGSAVAAVWYRGTLTTMEELKDDEKRAKDDAEDKLWQSYKAKAAAVRNGGRMGQRVESLAALTAATDIVRRRGGHADTLAGLRNDLIATLALPDVRYGPEVAVNLPDNATTDDPLVFDPDYTLAAVCDAENAVRFVSLTDGTELGRVNSRAVVLNGLVQRKFSPDGKLLAVSVGNGQYGVHSVPKGGRRSVFRGPTRTTHFDFAPDGRRVYAGLPDGTVRGYSTTNGQEEWRPDPKSEEVGRTGESAVAVSPDGSEVAVCRIHGTAIRVYSTATGRLLNDVPIYYPAPGPEVSWHPNGKWVGITYGEGADVADVFDADTDARVAKLEGAHTVAHLTFHPNGWIVAAVGWDNTTRFWNLLSNRPLLTLPYITGHARFSRDGRFYGSTITAPFRVHEFISPTEYRSLGLGRAAGSGNEHSPPRLSPDGRLLAAVTPTGTHLLDLASGRLLASFGNTAPLSTPSIRPAPGCPPVWAADGRGLHFPISKTTLAYAPVRIDGTAVEVGPPRPLWVNGHQLDDLTVLPDRRTVVNPIGGTYTLDGGRERAFPQRPQFRTQAGSAAHPGGKLVATAGWHVPTVLVWDAESGRTVVELPFGAQTHPTFTPDGRFLILARDQVYAFFDTTTWAEVRRVTRRVSSQPGPLAFSPDGSQVVLEIDAGVLTLFSHPDLREIARLEAPGLERAAFGGGIQFTPDGASLVFRTEPSTGGYRVWDLRAVRAGLAELNLDWDAPPYPPAVPVAPLTGGRVTGNPVVANPTLARKAALQWATLALAADPLDPGANRALALQAINGHRAEAALTHATLSLAVEPAQLDLRRVVCTAALDQGRWNDAHRWAADGIRLHPDSGEATEFRYFRAVAALGRNKPADALADLDVVWPAVKDTKTRNDLRGLVADARAAALLALGQADEARDAQATAAEITGSAADFRSRAAALLLGPPGGRHTALSLAVTRGLVAKPTVTAADQFLYDLALFRAGRVKEATTRITGRLKLPGGATRAEWNMVLALCRAEAGEVTAAATAIKEAEREWEVRRPTLSAPDQHRIDRLLDEARTACVGRSIR
jgi:WD40 repeat protein/tetratricopeptide (TPR) repeat protein